MSEIEEFDFYTRHKASLEEASRRGAILKRRPMGGSVGLLNQGATCYLNSLIQCLFGISAFRDIIFAASNETPIVKELQLLFSNLLDSNKVAVGTQNLTDAFGWNKMQMFEQHDIHEFFGTLVDALGRTHADLNSSLLKLFQGQCQGNYTSMHLYSWFSEIFINLPSCVWKRYPDVLRLRL
jgi:ubiquitin C-terminal hydrolase